MLIGISPLIGPDLLLALYTMGHGDEIVFADAHFPGIRINPRVIRADGLLIPPLLDAVLPLLAFDRSAANSVLMMAVSPGDTLDPMVEAAYAKALAVHWPGAGGIAKLERYEFYTRASQAFAVVMTGDTAPYANIILRKGVTPFPAVR